MTIPAVVNTHPSDSETFSPEDTFRFGVRDADYRVNHRQINAFVTFSGASYDPSPEDAVLPLDFPFEINVFSDGTPVSSTATRADLLLGDGTDVAQQVLVISSPNTTKKSSVLFLHAEATDRAPTGAGFRFAVPDVPPRGVASPYQTDNVDYAGVLFGFVHWGRQTGVFLFCSESISGDKYLRITGPLTLSGRIVSEEIAFDWSSPDYSFRVFFDNSGYLNKVIVLAVDESTLEETKIFEYPISGLGSLIASARLGTISAETAVNGQVTAFIGLDQTREGSLEVYSLSADTHGTPLIVSAGTEASHTGTTHASGIIAGALQEDVAALQQDAVTWLENTDRLLFASTGAGSKLRSDEPALVNNQWLLYFFARPDQAVHIGSYNTGMGADISSGEFVTRVRFLSDDTKDIGVYTAAVTENPSLSANYERFPANWSEESQQVLLISDGAMLHVLHGTDTLGATVVEELVALPEIEDSAAPARFEFGIIDAGTSGFMLTESLMFAPLKEVLLGDLTAWTLEGLSASVSTFTAIRPTDAEPVSFYHRNYAEETYEAGTTGIVVVMQARIGDITDAFGQTNPVRIPSPALLAVRMDAGSGLFVQLQFITAETGEQFVFVSQDAQDYREVLNPASELGALISGQVDFTVPHYYVLAVQPGLGLRLFVDFNPTPIISIPWELISTAIRSDAGDLLESNNATVAIGSIPTLQSGSAYNRMDADVLFAAVGIGSGYDFSVVLGTPRAELESKVYGTDAHIIFDIADTDP